MWRAILSVVPFINQCARYCPRLWDTAVNKTDEILCPPEAHMLGHKLLLSQILDFSRAKRTQDQSNKCMVFCIPRKPDALLQPISYNKNHIIFMIFAKTNSHREFSCEMLCIYLRVPVNWLHCESERLFDFASLRSGKMQHKNSSVPKRTDSLQTDGLVTLPWLLFPHTSQVGAIISHTVSLVHDSLLPHILHGKFEWPTPLNSVAVPASATQLCAGERMPHSSLGREKGHSPKGSQRVYSAPQRVFGQAMTSGLNSHWVHMVVEMERVMSVIYMDVSSFCSWMWSPR